MQDLEAKHHKKTPKTHSMFTNLTTQHFWKCQLFRIWFFFLWLFRAARVASGSSQARSWIGATAVGLRHSHGNSGSVGHLRPTSQLVAMLDPWRTEPGQGWNPHSHGYKSDLFLLSLNRNSETLRPDGRPLGPFLVPGVGLALPRALDWDRLSRPCGISLCS